MAFAGDIISLLVSLAQEIGIVLGVGALTITLIGHLLSLHAKQDESVFGYMRAARNVRAVALGIIILSGLAAVMIHVQTGTLATVASPAFLFKLLLIGLVTALYFFELDVRGWMRDAVEGFEGAHWYALFIVHAVAPAVGWVLLVQIYAGWLITFGVIWAAFVWFMRRQSKMPAPVANQTPAPQSATTPTPVVPSAPKPTLPMASKSAQPTVIASKPLAPPAPTTVPMIAELDLPAPKSEVPPVPKPAEPESTLPRIEVMPKKLP